MNPLNKTLQSRINRLSHRQALEHESRIKQELTRRLQQALKDGSSVVALMQILDGLENAPPVG